MNRSLDILGICSLCQACAELEQVKILPRLCLDTSELLQVAFVGFTLQAQATGKGPLENIADHLADPFKNNILTNIGECHIPKSVNVEGITIPLTCLWPGQQVG